MLADFQIRLKCLKSWSVKQKDYFSFCSKKNEALEKSQHISQTLHEK